MAFVDELYNRYGTQNVIRLSTVNSTSTGSVDATVIASVLSDVEGWFKTYVGAEYDSTDKRMLGLAADVGILLLRRRAGEHGDFSNLWADAEKQALALRKVTHSDTITAEKQLANIIAVTATDKSYFDSSTMYNKGFPPLSPSVADTFYSIDYP